MNKEKPLSKNKGSILGVVVVIMLLITIIGYGLLNLSGLDALEVAKHGYSTQAFWLAEAGIQQAFYNLPAITGIFTDNGIFGEGKTYTVDSMPTSPLRWTINSTGTANNSTRQIRVKVGPNITNAVTLTGTLKAGGEGHINPSGSYEENASLTFQKIFGINETAMRNNSNTEVVDTTHPNKPNDPPTTRLNGIFWVTGDLKITNSWHAHSGILIVNGNFSMQGSHFDGVIWVNGKIDNEGIDGNDIINGAVFINDPANGEVKIAGGSTISFDTSAIDAAFELLPVEAAHHIISWEEISS